MKLCLVPKTKSPIFSTLLLSAALLAATPLGAAQRAEESLRPSLGWLGGETGSPLKRVQSACDSSQLKRGALAKVGRQLAALYCNPQERRTSALAPLDGSSQLVTIDAASADPEALAREMKALGAQAISIYGPMVSAQFPIARIDALAAAPSLRMARPAAARVNTGSVTGQHVAALEIAGLTASGLDGSGVTIGVLSDSFDCLGGAAADIAADDLPAGASALLDEAGCASGTDEGRAMMQLIHDLVPGASQTFHTAFGGQATFANGIQSLETNGASVIVDDVTYFAEPMFQDGVVAQAVDDVTSVDNVLYFSSAGNSDDVSYEANFVDSAVTGPFGGALHDFDPGAGVDTLQQITVPTGDTTVILNWDQPYFSATGGAGSATDLDIHVYNGTTYLFSASTDNLGADPIEILGITNTGAPTSVNLAIEYVNGPSGPTPVATFAKYVILNDTTIDEYDTASGTSFGHANAEGAITVGAANYYETPAFGVTPPLIASYSSHGGVPILFDLADLPVGPIDRGKPEIVGPDGANNTFFGSDITHATDLDTDPNFFGTSASAPAVAALGAMMKQADATISPSQAESCLVTTALDMGAAGYDAETGNGWVQSEAALICGNYDWGDLPDAFGTTDANSGASHGLLTAGYLGASVDAEADGVPDSAALGDDAAGDDEDGIVFLDPLIPLRQARIRVTASQAGYLNAWIDFDGDLAFGAGEQIRIDEPVVSGTSNFQISVPANATGVMYSRFRFTTDDPAGALGPTGSWLNGEVEDYALAVLGDRVWSDDGSGGGGTGDGIQNGTEGGVSAATIYLLDAAGKSVFDALSIPISVVSDANGLYEVPGLPPGDYRLEFELPGGSQGFSPANVGDDALDSDPDIFSGRTATYSLAAGETDTSVDAGTQIATLALISGLTAQRADDGVLVEWETASEVGSLGFELYRRGAKGWQRVTAQPVTASWDAPQGGLYTLLDAEAPSDAAALEYALGEIETSGRLRIYGPFQVPVVEGAAAGAPAGATEGLASMRPHQRSADRVSHRRGAAHEAAQKAAVGRRAGSSAVAVGVARTGLVSIAARDLATTLGRPLGAVRKALVQHRLSLTLDGEPVPWYADSDGSGLLFFGRHEAGLYANETYYRIDLGRAGRPLPGVGAFTGRRAAQTWFEERLPFEEDLMPAISATEEGEVDFWHWSGVMAGHPTQSSADFELEVPGLVEQATPRLTVRLVGGNRGPAAEDHTALVRVNGEPVGEARFDDMERVSVDFELPPTILSASTRVTVEALAEDPAAVSFFFVEGFELAYRRALRATDDRLRFVVGPEGTASVDGFSGPDLVAVDVTDPDSPKRLESLRVEPGATYRGTVAARPGSTVEMARRRALAPAVGARAIAGGDSLRRSAGAEYLVIAPSRLLAGAERLADYRRADGLSTMVIEVERLQDEFTYSQPTPWAVREMLAYAAKEWPVTPRYVVLAGAGTFDPRDLLGHGDNLLTPVLAGTPQGLAAADNLLADLTGDGIAEFALGRIPVLTNKELEAYVDKLRRFEAMGGDWRRKAMLLADDPDSAGNFDQASEATASDLPAELEVERVYLSELGVEQTRQELLDGWREGALLVNYFGHGGTTQLAAERILSSDDVEDLANGGRSPILVAMTCVVGRFEVPNFDGLGERLVLHDEGGAIAVWAPTSLSTTGRGLTLSSEFYGRLQPGNGPVRLGDAVQGALEAARGEGADPTLATHTLLGDPALRVTTE